jgi:hypothetical protein
MIFRKDLGVQVAAMSAGIHSGHTTTRCVLSRDSEKPLRLACFGNYLWPPPGHAAIAAAATALNSAWVAPSRA